MKCLLLFIFFITFFGYSQKKIQFQRKSNIVLETENGLDTLNIIAADIKTKFGDFSIQLIDGNTNNKYLDFGKKREVLPDLFFSNSSDCFYISKYNANYIGTVFKENLRNLFPLNNFIINEQLFKLYKFRINNGLITAKIKPLKLNKKNLKIVYINHTLNFIDKLNKICLKSINNNKKAELKIKKPYLYVKIIDADLFINGSSYVNINFQEHYKDYNNIDVVYIIVNSTKEQIQIFNQIMKLKYPIYYIDKDNLKDRVLLGGLNYPRGLLFNKKGMLIRENVEPFDIDFYDK
jgi:hypothetical protein